MTTERLRVVPREDAELFDDNIERGVLVLMIHSRDACGSVLACGIDVSWFYRYKHRVMFRTLLRMYQQDLAVDITTIEAQLKMAGDLAEAGGKDAVMDLFGVIPMLDKVKTYVEMLRKMYRTRTARDQAAEAKRLIESGEIDEAQKLLRKATAPVDKPAEREGKPEKPRVFTPRAPAGTVMAITDIEASALVAGIKALAALAAAPSQATRDAWIAAMVFFVPFANGEARAQAMADLRAVSFTALEFSEMWNEAVQMYSRPSLVGTASLSQKIVEHMRSGGREDVLPISHGYGIQSGCFVRRQMVFESGRWVEEPPLVLTNFTSWIVSQDIQDDGSGVPVRVLRIAGSMSWGEPLPEFEIAAEDWTKLSDWLHKHWGHKVIVFSRKTNVNAVLEAMALYSMDAPERRVYTHTGWIKMGGRNVFLSPSGPIGLDEAAASEFAKSCAVSVHNTFRYYATPASVAHEQAIEAYHWLERFMSIADMSITAPMVSALFLAPLSSLIRLNFILAFTGPSDSRKTSLVAAAMTAWGREIDSDALGMSFLQTKNYIEDKAFQAKDIPVVVDNYVPTISQEQARTLQGLAHAIGDGQGRGRMLDGQRSLSSKPCRGFMIITGEENCEQYSGTARMYICPMNKTSVNLTELTAIQIAGRQGKLAPAMTHYLNWLAGKMVDPEFADKLKQRWFELARRDQETSQTHGRLIAQRKWIDIGLELATESHPARRWRNEKLMVSAIARLDNAAGERGYMLKDNSITTRFFAMLKDLIDVGKIRVADSRQKAKAPGIEPDVFGWNINQMGEGTHPIFDKAQVAMWVDFDDEAPHDQEWYVYVDLRTVLTIMHNEMPNPMKDSEVAITAALEGERMLWVAPGERQRGRRSQAKTLPYAGRQRVIRIKGKAMIEALGFDRKEHE